MGFGLGDIGDAVGIAGDVIGIGQAAGLGSPGQADIDYRGMKKGIQWRVRDAQAAGVHPLAALGTNLAGPIVRPSGSGRDRLGASVSNLGGSIGRYGSRQEQQAQAARQEQRVNRESASQVRLNESQALLNEARSRTLMQEMRANPTVTSQAVETRQLDPSHIVNPHTKRLSMWQDAFGNWHRVNQNITPQQVLEDEYGEAAEAHGVARAAYGYKPPYGWSAQEIIQGLRSLMKNP